MKLEDQVCSLELAKRLKELGVKQDSQHYWWEVIEGKWEIMHNCHRMDINGDAFRISAFTVAEMGEMLRGHKLPFWTIRAGWETPDDELDGSYYADTEADARAKMLIYLIEKGLVKP